MNVMTAVHKHQHEETVQNILKNYERQITLKLNLRTGSQMYFIVDEENALTRLPGLPLISSQILVPHNTKALNSGHKFA